MYLHAQLLFRRANYFVIYHVSNGNGVVAAAERKNLGGLARVWSLNLALEYV